MTDAGVEAAFLVRAEQQHRIIGERDVMRVALALRAEGVEPTLVLWSLSKAVRDLWASLMSGPAGPARESRRPEPAKCP
jgi:hypothetical protein